MRIPESISQGVYGMRHPWVWTLMVWAVAGAALPLMLEVSGAWWMELTAFVCCGLGFAVGCVPLVCGEENRAHYVLAVAVGVLSQAWVLMATWDFRVGAPRFLMLATVLFVWANYVFFLPLWSRWWCLVAELLCMGTVACSVAWLMVYG